MRRAGVVLLLLAGCASSKPARPAEPNEPFPHRVHAAEDFETDIERRWWLAGALETENVPPGSRRACRGTNSKDFDNKMGDPAARYTAVIFNPVPGPPMGRLPRLRFRCWLRGTDRLRVQIYSLTNNYHRRLELTDVPQGAWHQHQVDMRLLRRPDGSGGPLSEDERIDDIQFYVDPSAELIIDDIVLYDGAVRAEPQRFPSRILFTGWFDTGKQGQEWPGDYEIVAHEKPQKWKAARSVNGRVRLSLRGPRPVEGRETHVCFQYRLAGAEEFSVSARSGPEASAPVRVQRRGDAWSVVSLTLPVQSREVDALEFAAPADATLWLDDVLLYVPAR